MIANKHKTAYIVASLETEVRTLSDLLRNIGLQSLNGVVGSPASAAQDAIITADVVVAVVDDRDSEKLMFEIGLAIGANRPVVVISPSLKVVQRSRVFWIRASLHDLATISSQLSSFLDDLGRGPSESGGSFREVQPVGAPLQPPAPNSELERALLEAFERSIEVTSVVLHPRSGTQRPYVPDFAIWLAAAAEEIPGPLIIEVKGSGGNDSAANALYRLRSYLDAFHAPSGLLIYPGAPTSATSVAPLLFCMDLAECLRRLNEGTFVDGLRSERNRLAHSAA